MHLTDLCHKLKGVRAGEGGKSRQPLTPASDSDVSAANFCFDSEDDRRAKTDGATAGKSGSVTKLCLLLYRSTVGLSPGWEGLLQTDFDFNKLTVSVRHAGMKRKHNIEDKLSLKLDIGSNTTCRNATETLHHHRCRSSPFGGRSGGKCDTELKFSADTKVSADVSGTEAVPSSQQSARIVDIKRSRRYESNRDI